MRLYCITSTPVDGCFTRAHVWAGNSTLAKECFAGVYPNAEISSTLDLFEIGKPGLIAECVECEPEELE